MKPGKGLKNSKTAIISIIILDIILMVLFLFFSDLILKDFQNSSNISIIIIAGFAIVIPGTLIILIIIQFYSLYKNKEYPGNSFKKNIIYYFLITMVLVAIPQGVISNNFINASTNNWLNNMVKEAVNIGFFMALDVENSKKKELSTLSENSIFKSILKESYLTTNHKENDILQLNSSLSSIEYFNLDGQSLKFIGDEKLHLFKTENLRTNFFYPKSIIDNFEVIKYQYKQQINDQILLITLSSKLPLNFTKNGTLLTEVKKTLSLTDSKSTDIKIGMFIYYSLFSIPLILLAILGCFIFSDVIIKPIKDIEDAIKRVAKGNYTYRILSKKNNEFNILISSFNNMMKQIESSRNKLKHTEQISTWQDIATRLAHEIRNPLTPIKLSAQRVLMKESENTHITNYMQTIISEVTRMEKLLNEFRDFARFPKLQKSSTSIKKTIEESVNLFKSTNTNIDFSIETKEDQQLFIDKSQIIQVISNLTINSIHAIPQNGQIIYKWENITKKGTEFCVITIKDNGCGISKDIIENIFKPYFTTKYNGSGLGLAIVNKIILDHKGKIWIESAEGMGTTFYIELPKE